MDPLFLDNLATDPPAPTIKHSVVSDPSDKWRSEEGSCTDALAFLDDLSFFSSGFDWVFVVTLGEDDDPLSKHARIKARKEETRRRRGNGVNGGEEV